MKVSDLLQSRRRNWQELERLCRQMETRRRSLSAAAAARFAALYRAACADLALADAYQLPPGTVSYLHTLVGRAHNQLYRSRKFDLAAWRKKLLVDVPQGVFNDRCVQLAFCLFWGIFILSAVLAASTKMYPEFAEQMLGQEYLDRLESDFSQPIAARHDDPESSPLKTGLYIQHNTSIGLQCFAGGLLIIPGLFITVFNAAYVGTMFGYMARPSVVEGENFFHFVTAHGPFELTAVVLSAGAGLRLGMAWINTGGLTRTASLRKTAVETMPVMGSAMIMFFLAAMIEGFLSPSAAPYWWVKVPVAALSAGLLLFYFVVLGFPRGPLRSESSS